MQIKIGPITYEVVTVPGLRDGADGKKLFGEIKYGSCEIRVESNYAPQQTRQTLWHEIVHIVLVQLGRADESNDEALVDGMAYALMRVIEDNPWLGKNECEEPANAD